MPRLDGTGPRGRGAGTGRGAGNCGLAGAFGARRGCRYYGNRFISPQNELRALEEEERFLEEELAFIREEKKALEKETK